MEHSTARPIPTLPAKRRGRSPRRLLAISVTAGISGTLMYGHMDTQMMGIPFWLFAGLLYMTAVGSSAAIIFRHFPRLAPFVELTTISRFLLALAATQSHDLALALTTSPVLNATLIVSGALAIRAIASARSGARRGIPLATAG